MSYWPRLAGIHAAYDTVREFTSRKTSRMSRKRPHPQGLHGTDPDTLFGRRKRSRNNGSLSRNTNPFQLHTNMPFQFRRSRKTRYRRTKRKRSFRRRRGRKLRFGETKMRGGRKLKLMTKIIPKETFVKLPFIRTIDWTKQVTSSDGNLWYSLRNSLYFPLIDSTGARIQQMVRGADAWASFYRQYEIIGMKVTAIFSRTENPATSSTVLCGMLHTGAQDRGGVFGTARYDDIRGHKNTKFTRGIWQGDRAGVTVNGGTMPLVRSLSTYVSVKGIARDSENKSSTTALTGLPATAGASGTDATFGAFCNIGFTPWENGLLANAVTDYGTIKLIATYYVRYFDRKYFNVDLDGDGDEGPATAQTVAPLEL